MPPRVTFAEPSAAPEAEEAAREKRRKALSRVKARVSALSAIKSATLNYEAWDSRFWGYDSSQLTEDEKERPRDQAEDAGRKGQRAQSEALHAVKGERTKSPSRRLVTEPERFYRTNRAITVRSGNPADQEYAKMKAAELKLLCSLTVLGSDMNHHRHLYLEMKRQQTDRGKTKYYRMDDVIPLQVPHLWLKDSNTACEYTSDPADKELNVERTLQNLPQLWNAFYQHRKKKTEHLQKERPRRNELLLDVGAKKLPPSKYPGKSVAPPPEAANAGGEGVKATSPPPPAGKGPPPPPAGKGPPPPPAGKGPPPPPPGKGPPPPPPGKGKGPPPPKK